MSAFVGLHWFVAIRLGKKTKRQPVVIRCEGDEACVISKKKEEKAEIVLVCRRQLTPGPVPFSEPYA